jgi:hypothetical protein
VRYAIDGLRGVGDTVGDAVGDTAGDRDGGTRPGEPGWLGPEWDDPVLTTLARRLRDAHRLVTPLPADTRRRLIRQLLAITDLAKRDPELAARRLATFLADFDAGFEDAAELE